MGGKVQPGWIVLENLSYYSFGPIGDAVRDVPLQLCVYGNNIDSLAWPQMVFIHNAPTMDCELQSKWQ
jgi:hypothetical protein